MPSESPSPLPSPAETKPGTVLTPEPGAEGSIVIERITQLLTAKIDSTESQFDEAVAKKLTGGHVDKLIDLMSLHENNRHTEIIERHRNRPYLAAGLIIIVLVFVLLLTWLALAYSKAEIVVPVLTGIVGLVGGAIGGYGYGRSHPSIEQTRNTTNP